MNPQQLAILATPLALLVLDMYRSGDTAEEDAATSLWDTLSEAEQAYVYSEFRMK